MKPAKKPAARRKVARRAPTLTILQRVKRLEGAVFPPVAAAVAVAVKASRFTNLDAKGKPTTGEHVAVFDSKTGLVWSAEPLQGGKDLNHADAMQACKDLQLLGVKTWRAPSIEELLSIVDYGRDSPAVNTDHFKGPFGWTWSATVAKSPSGFAWSVLLGGGNSCRGYQGDHYLVRAVCAGQQFGLGL